MKFLNGLLLPGVLVAALALAGHAEAVSPRRLVEVVDIGNLAISPDGAYVAFRTEQASIERNTYDTTWYVQGMDGRSPPRRVADGGVPLRNTSGISVPVTPVWSADGRWIYYRALMDGKIDVWRAATDGSGAEPLSLDAADIREFSVVDGGRAIRYSVGAAREAVIAAEQSEYDQGIRIDRTVPIGQSLFRSGFIEGRKATQRLQDNEVIRYPMLGDVPDRWMELDMSTRAKREVPSAGLSKAPAGDLAIPDGGTAWKQAREPDGDRVAILMRTGNGEGLVDKPDVELMVLDSKGKQKPLKCTSESCVSKAITGIQWRPGTDEVLFTVTDPVEGHVQSVHRWAVGSGAVRQIAASSGQLSGGRDRFTACGVSPSALACVAADPGRPPRLEAIDLERGSRRELFDPNASLASDMAGTPVRLLRWTDSKGHQFTGQYYPATRKGGAPSPLFVNYYWCVGYVRGGLGDETPFASFAEHGISALCINRLPTRLDAVERYELGRSAVESAVDLLASSGEVDRARVGMGGLSFGAETTFWTIMNSDVLAAASVSSPGISQLFQLLLSNYGEAFYPRLRAYWQLGTPEQTKERWDMISPASNLSKIRSPLLMQLPEQEYIHSMDYAIPLMNAHLADVYVFPEEPHQKFQPRHKLAVYERNLDWFRFWLQGVEDPAPEKCKQYAVWRQMKEGIPARMESSGSRAGN
jgi:hypothetical protein